MEGEAWYPGQRAQPQLSEVVPLERDRHVHLPVELPTIGTR